VDFFSSAGALPIFFAAVLNISPETVMKYLNSETIGKLIAALNEIIERDCVKSKEIETDGENEINWNELYYFGRYRLGMNDEEFWSCTPRRFAKLSEMFTKYEIGTNGEPVIENNPQAFIDALGG
jgi:hypothetical protein